ncbi:hypothetical protein GGX14DRAFT_619056 [Mycena pura]|uniref:Uncharacterized protein n=1 Tax=Mycena pura TaxID=153505 RepID=A0AAD6VI46_9AGAR|nr:hypothetical protein GGX14DRAFT_619056 [Mycena pura]
MLFDCAVVLLVNVWALVGVGGRQVKTRSPEDLARATADVWQNCLRVLSMYERRWVMRGHPLALFVYLNTGMTDGEMQADDAPTPASASARDGFPDEGTPLPSTSKSLATESQNRAPLLLLTLESIHETDAMLSLQLTSEELGRLPVYDSFSYEFAFQVDASEKYQYHGA